MDMIPHDAEVVEREGVLLFQVCNVLKKQDTHIGIQENELAPVYSRGDMVSGVRYQESILPHNSIFMGLRCVALQFLVKKVKKVCVPF